MAQQKVRQICLLTLLEYACPVEANTVGIKFLRFTIRDTKTQATVFDSDEAIAKMMQDGAFLVPNDPRKIRYTFDADMLISKEVGTRYFGKSH